MVYKKNSSYGKSFGKALQGLIYTLKTERNLRFHVVSACLVLFLAWYFQVSQMELLILLLVIFLVIILELVNTAIENTVDLAYPEYHPLAKIAKDVAAAAVLMAALGASIIGLLIFYKYLF